MKAFGRIAFIFQGFRKLIHHSLGIAENQGSLNPVIIQKAACNLHLNLAVHTVIILLYKRNGQLLLGHLQIDRILLVGIGNLQDGLGHCG